MDVFADLVIGAASAAFVWKLYRNAAAKGVQHPTIQPPQLFGRTELAPLPGRKSPASDYRPAGSAITPVLREHQRETPANADLARDPTKIMMDAMCGPGVCTPLP